MIPASILSQVSQWHAQGLRIVLVTGVFDLLHVEHQNFLRNAKSVGDILCVGVESDVRVRRLKGVGRPIWREHVRRDRIAALDMVDAVWVLPEQFDTSADHEHLIATVCPAILAVSSHSPHQDKKRQLVEKYGGILSVVHQQNPNISTTGMLEGSSAVIDY